MEACTVVVANLGYDQAKDSDQGAVITHYVQLRFKACTSPSSCCGQFGIGPSQGQSPACSNHTVRLAMVQGLDSLLLSELLMHVCRLLNDYSYNVMMLITMTSKAVGISCLGKSVIYIGNIFLKKTINVMHADFYHDDGR